MPCLSIALPADNNRLALKSELADWRQALLTRRRFLLASAGGLAALFAPVCADALADTAHP